MTITVTPNPLATPPSTTVAVSLTAGYVMSSVALYRNDHNGRTLLRSQPSAGFDSRTVTDYECPYEENVTYYWATTFTDPTAYSTVFNETWASTAAWTATQGSWAVAAGKVHNTGAPSNTLQRAVTLGKYRFTFTGIADTIPGLGKISLIGGTTTLLVTLDPGGTLRFNAAGFSQASTIDGASPFIVDFNTSSVTVSGTGGTIGLPIDMSVSTVRLSCSSASTFTVDDIKMQSYPAPTSLDETSSPVTLEPAEAWLIHPGSAGLSVPLSETDTTAAGIIEIAPVENQSNATVHKILGSATPVPTTTGPRTDDRTTMTVATVTTAESVALRALLAPDVPLLIQIPPSWELDFNSGFYQVGDTSAGRTGEPQSPRRVAVLPLQKVQSPVVDVENGGWSYAAVAVEFATYTDLTSAYATYADLASDTRT